MTITKEQAQKLVDMVNLANDIKYLIEPGCSTELRDITDKFLKNISGVVSNELFVKNLSPYDLMFNPGKDNKYSLGERSPDEPKSDFEVELSPAGNNRDFEIDMIDYQKYWNNRDVINNSKPSYDLQEKDHTIATAKTAVKITNRLIQDPLFGGEYSTYLHAIDGLPEKVEKLYYNFKDTFAAYSNSVVFSRGSKFSIVDNPGTNETILRRNLGLETKKLGKNVKRKEKDLEIG